MAGIGSLDFHLNIIFLYACSPLWSGEQLGTITGEAQQCRVAGGQESLAIKQSPQLRKVQNPGMHLKGLDNEIEFNILRGKN
jgi:hypothetical protein